MSVRADAQQVGDPESTPAPLMKNEEPSCKATEPLSLAHILPVATNTLSKYKQCKQVLV